MRLNFLLKETLRPVYNYINNKNYREFMRLYNKYGKFERYKRVNEVKFLNYIINVPDLPSFIWQFKEIFVDEIYKFESSSDAPIIYDCGANIGISALFFKKLFPKAKIKAFEADPQIASILKSNLQKNNINDVEVIEKAVWINYEGIYFGVEGADGGSIYKTNDRKIIVESIKLKDFIDAESKIDFLKMDIEGSEFEVIKDCDKSLGKVKNIFIEYHSFRNMPQKLSEILKILEANNFRYYLQNVTYKKYPFMSNNEILEMDFQINIFGSKDD